MEIDMQSPPSTFRLIPGPIKRPRSPGSPTQERQTKRPSLAPVDLEIHSSSGRRAFTASDGVGDGGMASPDDWVQQARALSITSPLSVHAGRFNPPAMHGGTMTQSSPRQDEHMAVDDEDNDDEDGPPALRGHVHHGTARSWTTARGHLPPIQITTTTAAATLGVPALHVPSPAPFSVPTGPPSSSSSDSASSTSSLPVMRTGATRSMHLRPPDIFLFPATPADMPHDVGEGAHVRMDGEGLLQSTTLVGTPGRGDGRAGSPRPTRVGDMPTASGRKHRVTMGPRADCAKCRAGVRGHWMHFDS